MVQPCPCKGGLVRPCGPGPPQAGVLGLSRTGLCGMRPPPRYRKPSSNPVMGGSRLGWQPPAPRVVIRPSLVGPDAACQGRALCLPCDEWPLGAVGRGLVSAFRSSLLRERGWEAGQPSRTGRQLGHGKQMSTWRWSAAATGLWHLLSRRAALGARQQPGCLFRKFPAPPLRVPWPSWRCSPGHALPPSSRFPGQRRRLARPSVGTTVAVLEVSRETPLALPWNCSWCLRKTKAGPRG